MDVIDQSDWGRPRRKANIHKIHTNWPSSTTDLIRLTAGEPRTVHISAPDAVAVGVSCNFNGAWHDIAAIKTTSTTFRVELNPRNPGSFTACVFAVFADGEYWDGSGPIPVIVDPEWIDNSRTYTMIPTASGTISNWILQLDEIEALGYNAIHLLPVSQMGTAASPYAAADFFHVDARYRDTGQPGTADEQFQTFVDTMQSRGLRLCIDLVFNHVGLEGKIIDEHPDWIVPDLDEKDHLKRAGWWCGPDWMKWDDVVLLDFDHWHPPTREALWQHMLEYGLHWARYAAQTGGLIRLDNLHSTHPKLLSHALTAIRKQFPNLGILAELFADLPSIDELVRKHGLNLLLATPWEHHFTPDLRWYLQELHNRMPCAKHLIPMASHDSGSPAQMYGNPLATVPRFALSALFGLGATGSVQGTEYGLPKGVPFIGFSNPIDGKGLPDYRNHVTTLNNLHATIPELRISGNLRMIDGDHPAILAAIRGSVDTQELLVAVNMDLGTAQHLDLAWISETTWTDVLSSETFDVTKGPLTVEPAGYRILKRQYQ